MSEPRALLGLFVVDTRESSNYEAIVKGLRTGRSFVRL